MVLHFSQPPSTHLMCRLLGRPVPGVLNLPHVGCTEEDVPLVGWYTSSFLCWLIALCVCLSLHECISTNFIHCGGGLPFWIVFRVLDLTGSYYQQVFFHEIIIIIYYYYGKLKQKLDKILWYKRALESNSVKPLDCDGNISR